MAVTNPAWALTGVATAAETFRRLVEAIFVDHHGVTNGLAVTEKSGTPNMSVDISAGRVVIDGTEATNQGKYFAESRSVENLVIAAADATNARKDLVCARIEDSDYSGATDAWSLYVETGTPSGSPAEPATDPNVVILAMVDVAALDTAIEDAEINDRRKFLRPHGETQMVLGNDGQTMAANGVYQTNGVLTFTQPHAGAVHLFASVTAYVIQTGDNAEKVHSLKLEVSTDGGSTWTGSRESEASTSRDASAPHNRYAAMTVTYAEQVTAASITGDIQVRARLKTDLRLNASWQDTQISASWRPAFE